MSASVQFKRQNLLYQPTLTPTELTRIGNGEFDEISRRIRARSDAERICVDRLAMILRNLPKPIAECSFLDLGCANGFFGNVLAYLGARSCIGIDSDAHRQVLELSVESALMRARLDAHLYGVEHSRFLDRELNEAMSQDNRDLESDVTIFFSVLHHLFFGYGFLNHSKEPVVLGDRPKSVFQWIDRHTRGHLFFEIHEGIFADWKRETIPDQIKKFTSFTSVTHLGDSDGYEDSPRGVWLCSRSH